MRLSLVGLVAFFSIASALPGPRLARTLSDPSTDPFYQPPAGFESKAPGTILAQREIDSAFLGFIPTPVEAHQLLYRTTAINGSAISTVTTVFKPKNAKSDRFISFATAYDSAAVKCNPSYTYRLGAPQDSLLTSIELLVIEAYILLGYTVASPDYEGPDAAFGAGRLAGMGVLDGIRAVASFDTLGLGENPMVVGIGYSGGAIATGWAGSLQPTYAPELNIKGWVQGGTPANLTGTMVTIDDASSSGFLPIALAGLSAESAYGSELDPVFNKILTKEGHKVIDDARSQCVVEDLLSFSGRSIVDTQIQTLGQGFFTEPTIQSVLQKNTMATNKDETPTAPTLVYHATHDEIVPYANATAMVTAWCDWGANVKFSTYAVGAHGTIEIIALPEAIRFTQDAFDGKTTSGCTRNTEILSILDPLAFGLSLEPLFRKLGEGLAHWGPEDANVKEDISMLRKTL